MFLMFGVMQLHAQIDPDNPLGGDGEKPCLELVNVKQECNEDGTVDITFQISNNTLCDASAVTIMTTSGVGVSYNVGINGQTVSTPFTHSGAAPGTTLCLDIILHGKEGRECCRERVCFKVTDECCELTAEIGKLTCAPNGTANVSISGGTAPYSGPGVQNGVGNFFISGLSAGIHTLTYTDSVGCEIDVTFSIQGEKCCGFEANVINMGGCEPSAWAVIHVTGGSAPYSGPGWQPFTGYFQVQGLDEGPHVLIYTDSDGCEVAVTVNIPKCCDLEAEFIDMGGCPPDTWVRIFVSGGTQPYSGPGFQAGVAGNFIITGLDSGPHTFVFTDADDCEVEVEVTIPENDLHAEVTNYGGCGANGWAQVSVTGGTAPYTSSSGQTSDTGNFTFFGLSSGPHTLTFTDANGCTTTESVTIESTTLQATVTSLVDASCYALGSVIIELEGGNPPYSGPTDATNIFQNFWEITDLPVDDYTFMFTDSDGCAVVVEVTIDETLGWADCADFTFTRDENDNSSTNFYQEIFVSQIAATINVTLDAVNVPDQLIVYVNGTDVVNFSAGAYDCDGSSGAVESDQFCVDVCDIVRFEVHGDICPAGFTVWDLTVTCEEGCDNSGGSLTTNSDLNLRSNMEQKSDRYYEELLLNSHQFIKVSPNPVTDVLNIINTDQSIDFQTLRIIDSSGSVVHKENIEGQSQLHIDASTFPQGIYIVEMTDDTGNRAIEKFSKLD